ncbi:Histidinol dehydrogenase [Candidatus Syntrophocurvum alkaliphilum]|uniref:Histidinol dehydrogenase n=1 Tax=Candidatus Syntrophocurvum alkaliphilum TaxID=2293317 RepID=A0A6I6D8C1_9FIRM|nr:histidinol dehydrogenase [Candidatus Syntrophocurvum alkaliphilum]QGT98817.1 Histidinol dehydrogenase [Candidatus Syntrophocurvum alkaliphilum]
MKIRKFNGKSEEFMAFLEANYADMKEYEAGVAEIGKQVKERGNQAIFDYNLKFDGAQTNNENFMVSEADIDEAYEKIDDEYLIAIRRAIDNITEFHLKQKRNSWLEPDESGTILGQVYRPLQRVGIYVPGGTAAYPSSVLMNAIPAQVAGVEEIVMVTPPGKDGKLNPYTLVAAAELGISEIYKMGGAHSVFALAWGTETVEKVDLISGPGNIYVTIAKKMVYGDIDIDMLAGPSEILIIADSSADPAYLAADLMSQAEHDVLARSLLVTDDASLVEKVEEELQKQIQTLSRKDIIEKSLESYGAFVVTTDMEEACEVSNIVAPEHLEVMVEHPFELLSKIHNAGAIFLGENTPEPVGDYYAGPNHILPTGGTARFYSPVTVDTFTKASSIIFYSKQGLMNDADQIIKLAEVEGLTAHANSVRIRKEK